MNLFFCNTPYLIEVNETNQIASKVELFIWNDTEPTDPTYTFEKTAPSTSVTANYYDIAPFVKEFLPYQISIPDLSDNGFAEFTGYVNVKVKCYSDIGSGFTLVNTYNFVSLAGTYQISSSNYSGWLYKNNKIDYYNIDSALICVTNIQYQRLKWVNTLDNTFVTAELDPNKMYYVSPSFYGNKVGLCSIIGIGSCEYILTNQIEECKYTPVKIDFINGYGVTETTWFYKASKESFAVDNQQFRHLQTNNYGYLNGKQRQTFNTIGKQQFTVNSGWVDESYSNVIKDILMSEYILLDGQYALIDSKSIDIQKHINNKLINYQLTFTLANDYRR